MLINCWKCSITFCIRSRFSCNLLNKCKYWIIEFIFGGLLWRMRSEQCNSNIFSIIHRKYNLRDAQNVCIINVHCIYFSHFKQMCTFEIIFSGFFSQPFLEGTYWSSMFFLLYHIKMGKKLAFNVNIIIYTFHKWLFSFLYYAERKKNVVCCLLHIN